MQRNIGLLDRWLRIVLGAVLIGLVLNEQIGVWGWIGIVPVLTGLISRCPLYHLFGIRTCAVKKEKH